MISKEQNNILGNDWGFALLPYTFKSSITNYCDYDYNKENISDVLSVSVGKLGKFWKFIKGVKYLNYSDDKIILTQQQNQHSACLVPILCGVEKILVETQKDKKEFILESSVFKQVGICVVDFDFENPIKKVTLHFNFDLAEPLEIEITTILYKEPEIDYESIYLKNLNPSHSTGNDLVNIRFQKANGNVEKTVISLFHSVERSYNSGIIERQLLANYTIEKDVFFKSINGLAYGLYSYKISQYDKENNLIIETDYMNFRLTMPNYGGKPTIVI